MLLRRTRMSRFRVGEKVAVYSGVTETGRVVGRVVEASSYPMRKSWQLAIEIKGVIWGVHPKQCRRIVERIKFADRPRY
jgi:hypothetical protein